MFGVTRMRYSRNFYEQGQTAFGGYDHREAAGEGSIYDVMNMCADRYPALTVRPRRGRHALVAKPNGLFVRDCVCWVDGTDLVVDGDVVGQVTDSKKVIAGIQDKICIWPDKVLYDRGTGEMIQMEAEWSGEAEFSDGTYAGESALANTITVAGDLRGIFRAGDGVAVQLNEDGLYSEPMGAYVLQEIEYHEKDDITELRFYEETWRRFVRETESSGELEEGMNPFPGVASRYDVIIMRRAPELELAFEHNNRIWGAHDGTICCCKLGDPTNWEYFDGSAIDSWELVTGSPGSITGGISYGGHPVYFKERRIIRIYGDYPAQYSTSETESLGVEEGSGGSLAIAGDTLFYKSPAGIMAYTGGYPYSVSEEFGQVQYRNATAGSDGVKYYVSMEDYTGEQLAFCYDTRYRLWHKEDGLRMIGFGWNGELYAMEERGELLILGSPRAQTIGEDGIRTWVEFGDFTDGTTRKKGLGRVVLRLEMDEDTTLDISVRYDSSGEWTTVRSLEGKMVKGQTEVVIPLRRCDHYRLRIDGRGMGGSGWTLYALTRERYTGSNRK